MNDHGVTRNSGIAPLQNVGACMTAMEKAVSAPAHLPRITAVFGYSGIGKSTGALQVQIEYNAYYIEIRDTWTKKALAHAILKQMGIKPAGALWQMVDQIGEQLGKSRRPIIIDNAHKATSKKMIGMLQDIYEGAFTPMMLIGEEGLEIDLRHNETFHNRVSAWIPAQPADLEDARLLRDLYCRKVIITDDLLAHVVNEVDGTVRRIAINLEDIQEVALRLGIDTIDREIWGDRPIYTGEARR